MSIKKDLPADLVDTWLCVKNFAFWVNRYKQYGVALFCIYKMKYINNSYIVYCDENKQNDQ